MAQVEFGFLWCSSTLPPDVFKQQGVLNRRILPAVGADLCIAFTLSYCANLVHQTQFVDGFAQLFGVLKSTTILNRR
jgi:hypothetical protein